MIAALAIVSAPVVLPSLVFSGLVYWDFYRVQHTACVCVCALFMWNSDRKLQKFLLFQGSDRCPPG